MRADRAASLFLVGLAAWACAAAYRLGPGEIGDPGAGFMPLATAALLGLMALGRLAVTLARGDARGLGARPGRARIIDVLVVLDALAGFGRAIETLGFALSTFLMLAVLFAFVARKRWWVALLVALLVAAVARAVVGALGVPLPEGPLGI